METIRIDGKGFVPLKDYKTWRIAQMSYDPKLNSLEGFSAMGRHYSTDEVFMLLEGHAVMVTSGNKNTIESFEYHLLHPGFLYTVKEKQWHIAVLYPNTRLLIIENQDTGMENSEQYILSIEEKKEISMGITKIIKV